MWIMVFGWPFPRIRHLISFPDSILPFLKSNVSEWPFEFTGGNWQDKIIFKGLGRGFVSLTIEMVCGIVIPWFLPNKEGMSRSALTNANF